MNAIDIYALFCIFNIKKADKIGIISILSACQ